MHERSLRSTIVGATRQYEAALVRSIHAKIDSELLERWRQTLVTPHEAGLSQQSWPWAAPPHKEGENLIFAARMTCLQLLVPVSRHQR